MLLLDKFGAVWTVPRRAGGGAAGMGGECGGEGGVGGGGSASLLLQGAACLAPAVAGGTCQPPSMARHRMTTLRPAITAQRLVY